MDDSNVPFVGASGVPLPGQKLNCFKRAKGHFRVYGGEREKKCELSRVRFAYFVKLLYLCDDYGKPCKFC